MAQNPETIRNIDLVQRCLDGDHEAIAEAKEFHLPYLRGLLAQRGASADEINELIETIWSDCLVSDGTHPALFEKFDGKSALRPWLTAITVNRWISSKRRERVRHKAIEHLRVSQEQEILNQKSLDRGSDLDLDLVKIVENAIRDAFAECDAEGLVMLRLIHIHGLSRKEVAGLWASHESTISRRLSDTQVQIGDSVHRLIKQTDPFLELGLDDLLLFSESVHILLR